MFDCLGILDQKDRSLGRCPVPVFGTVPFDHKRRTLTFCCSLERCPQSTNVGPCGPASPSDGALALLPVLQVDRAWSPQRKTKKHEKRHKNPCGHSGSHDPALLHGCRCHVLRGTMPARHKQLKADIDNEEDGKKNTQACPRSARRSGGRRIERRCRRGRRSPKISYSIPCASVLKHVGVPDKKAGPPDRSSRSLGRCP